MAEFTIHKLVLSRFWDYPEWPIPTVEEINPKGKRKTSNYKDLVYCYGKHDTQFVNEPKF